MLGNSHITTILILHMRNLSHWMCTMTHTVIHSGQVVRAEAQCQGACFQVSGLYMSWAFMGFPIHTLNSSQHHLFFFFFPLKSAWVGHCCLRTKNINWQLLQLMAWQKRYSQIQRTWCRVWQLLWKLQIKLFRNVREMVSVCCQEARIGGAGWSLMTGLVLNWPLKDVDTRQVARRRDSPQGGNSLRKYTDDEWVKGPPKF